MEVFMWGVGGDEVTAQLSADDCWYFNGKKEISPYPTRFFAEG